MNTFYQLSSAIVDTGVSYFQHKVMLMLQMYIHVPAKSMKKFIFSIAYARIYPITKHKLANQKWMQISIQNCGISELQAASGKGCTDGLHVLVYWWFRLSVAQATVVICVVKRCIFTTKTAHLSLNLTQTSSGFSLYRKNSDAH